MKEDRTRSSLLLVWIVSDFSRLHILLQLKTQTKSSLQLELRHFSFPLSVTH